MVVLLHVSDRGPDSGQIPPGHDCPTKQYGPKQEAFHEKTKFTWFRKWQEKFNQSLAEPIDVNSDYESDEQNGVASDIDGTHDIPRVDIDRDDFT